MKRALVATLVVAVGALAGCSFTTELGPKFVETRVSGAGTVYFYRPSKLLGSRNIVHAYIDGDERLVLIGGYAAMRVPPGKHRVYAYSTPEWQYYVGYGFGPSAWRGQAEVQVADGGEAFVRLESDIGSVEVVPTSRANAMSEIEDCGLSAGGAPR
jgi:hypothetical protein